jgi:hypothetical protein
LIPVEITSYEKKHRKLFSDRPSAYNLLLEFDRAQYNYINLGVVILTKSIPLIKKKILDQTFRYKDIINENRFKINLPYQAMNFVDQNNITSRWWVWNGALRVVFGQQYNAMVQARKAINLIPYWVKNSDGGLGASEVGSAMFNAQQQLDLFKTGHPIALFTIDKMIQEVVRSQSLGQLEQNAEWRENDITWDEDFEDKLRTEFPENALYQVRDYYIYQ